LNPVPALHSFQLSAVKEMDITASPLTGPIPKLIVDCFPSLHKMKLADLRLSGPFPDWLQGFAPRLDYLKVNANPGLRGALPASWAAAPTLFWLDVSNTGASGPVPAGWPSLGVFRASKTNLTGDLLGLAGAPLQVVSISNAPGLCGPVPASVRWASGYDPAGTRLGRPCVGGGGEAVV
jgi:hypothetical protein